MSSEVFLVMWTQGHMTTDEVRQECSGQRFIPILVMRMDDMVLMPCFTDRHIAKRWVERNLPKKSVWGLVGLEPETAEWIDANGWRLKPFDFPQKVNDIVQMDVEIKEYEPGQEVRVNG